MVSFIKSLNLPWLDDLIDFNYDSLLFNYWKSSVMQAIDMILNAIDEVATFKVV